MFVTYIKDGENFFYQHWNDFKCFIIPVKQEVINKLLTSVDKFYCNNLIFNYNYHV